MAAQRPSIFACLTRSVSNASLPSPALGEGGHRGFARRNLSLIPARPRLGLGGSVLFELIESRYERRSMLITANQPFGEWGKVFPDQAMTLAAIDRLVHHSTIFEMNVESYRRRAALDRKRGSGRPPTH